MILTIAVAVIALTIGGLGAFVLLQRSKSKINLNFGLFALATAVWVIFNYIGANFKTNTITAHFVIADFASAPWMAYFFWCFTDQLYKSASKKKIKSPTILMLALAVIASALTFTGGILKISKHQNLFVTTYSQLFIIYALLLGIFIIYGLLNMICARRRAKNTLRKQLDIMIWGLSTAVIIITFANLVVPQLTELESINQIIGNVAYLGVVFFVSLTTYAIIRHRLFDVRLIVARSLAYILLLGSITSFYTLVVFGLSHQLFGANYSVITNQVIPVFSALVVAVTYQKLKQFFDRITNKIFYRDAYDPQAFIDQLNDVLVSTINLKLLIDQIVNVIETNLKPEFCAFGLKETEHTPQRIIGNVQKNFNPTDIAEVRAQTLYIHQKVIVTDELPESARTLQRILRKNNVAIVIRLTSDISAEQEGIGYIILGGKKSGNPYSKQDIRIMGTIANELVIAIQNSLRFEEIEQFNITLQDRVENATVRLRRTNEKLKALDETKDEFISMASHQLRTPLTSVKGYLSMVLEGDAGQLNDMQHKLLDQAFVSSQRMVYLIADLLNVSRLRTGKFVIEPVACNLADIIEGEVSQLLDTANSRNLKLIFEKPAHFPKLMLDETKIRQVVMNFTDNAIYYTPSGGKIILRLVNKKETVEFTVNDNGIGVPKLEQHHLFTKFYRAGNAKKARPDGTGLGLFMAQKVIIAQGGSILFRSQEGKGSTFGFTFAKDRLRVTPLPTSSNGSASTSHTTS